MSAIISECGMYRYRLERDVQPEGTVFAFFGVNPSTADATAEDATTRKWAGFCRANGARRYIAGNVYAFRATDVRQLGRVGNPVGPDNAAHLAAIIRDADVLVPCWGSRSKVPIHLRLGFNLVAQALRESGKPVRVFGLTESGDPKHPLMLGYSTPLVEWRTHP